MLGTEPTSSDSRSALREAPRAVRRYIGALLRDVPSFARAALSSNWKQIHNRNERVTDDGRGVRCDWEFTSELHIANVFPAAGARLMRMAFAEWPIRMCDAPPPLLLPPEITFVIGHRGPERLPHLLTTLRSIAGQVDAAVEVVVVEQDVEPRVAGALPPWVRYCFTPSSTDYNRAATLNAGVKAATAPVIVLHDNDMLAPAAYAAECRARLAEGFDFLEMKRFTFYLDQSVTQDVFRTTKLPLTTPAVIIQNLLGASVVARRDRYFEAGGFDEEFVGWGGEDNEFWERAEATGRAYRFGYLPFIHLFHTPQKGKADPHAPSVRRYHELRRVPVAERITRLRSGLPRSSADL